MSLVFDEAVRRANDLPFQPALSRASKVVFRAAARVLPSRIVYACDPTACCNTMHCGGAQCDCCFCSCVC